MMKKIFLAVVLFSALAAGLFFWRAKFLQKEALVAARNQKDLSQSETAKNETPLQDIQEGRDRMGADLEKENAEKTKDEAQQETPIREARVPFTSQAPLGKWEDQRLQNGCEEASVAMAMRWAQGTTFSSPSEAQQEIINISKFEEKTFGNSVDADTLEVGKIFSELYKFSNFTIDNNPSLADLKNELAKGNIILVPAYGRALKNPNYTQPGPITHMLVLVGYDTAAKEFITNDPGTKKGEGYRYKEDVLFEAVWAYPSSENHPEPPKSTSKKAMLVVRQN